VVKQKALKLHIQMMFLSYGSICITITQTKIIIGNFIIKCNYEKVGKSYEFSQNIYERLEKDENASQEEAIKRADTLFTAQSHLEYHNQNPVTLVYELVKFLTKNKRK